MYLIKTLQGNIQADHDEIEKIANSKGGFIFLRNGAVNPKHISIIVPDYNERATFFRGLDETAEDVERRIQEYRSKDLFAHIRNNSSISENESKTFLPC